MKKIITIDLGATKCAMGLVEYRHPNHMQLVNHARLRISEFSSLHNLLEKLEDELAFPIHNANAILIAAAGRYINGEIVLERGYPYKMNIAEIAKNSNWQQYEVVHDYTPLASATFTTYSQNPNHVKVIHNGNSNRYGRRLVVGVGTGLGTKDCVLLSNHDIWFGENEAGHIGITYPANATPLELQRHHELLHFIISNNILLPGEDLSFESILSGKGLERIYYFFTQGKEKISAKEISNRAMTCTFCQNTWECFAWYLGLFISTLQLTMMPTGGIWLAGGVLLSNLHIFNNTLPFTQGLNALSAYQYERQKMPIIALDGIEHIFYGGAYYACAKLLNVLLE